MKRLLTAGLLGFAMVGFGQGQMPVAEGNVPFDFHVGQTLLPAGQYKLSQSNDILIIRAAAGKPTVMLLTLPGSHAATCPNPKLVFQRYGNEYFLSEVWKADSPNGLAVPKSKQERELASRMKTDKGGELILQARNGNRREGK